MSFESKRDQMLAALEEKNKATPKKDTKKSELEDVNESFAKKAQALKRMKPKAAPVKIENTKAFTFTLQPSVRKKLARIAKKSGYASASKFLNEMIKNMEEEPE